MAKSITKSALANKLAERGKKAVAAHAGDDTTFDTGGSLPPGIENGIAQLIDCRFSTYEKGPNKGEYFFLAAGIIVSPETHNGVKIIGKRTQIMEPLCDTPQRTSRPTLDDHMAWILNTMRQLGADTKGATIENLEDLAAALKEAGPYFQFRTWQGEPTKQYPNPRVNEVWNGACDFDGHVQTEAVQDNTEAEPETGSDEEEAADDTQAADEEDLAALGAAADEGDKDAQTRLQELALEAGHDPDEIESWTAVAELLQGDGGEAGDEEESSDIGDAVPAKEEVWFYKPPRMRKYIEVEITAVFEGKRTCNAKNLEDGKTVYKSVSWDELKAEKP